MCDLETRINPASVVDVYTEANGMQVTIYRSAQGQNYALMRQTYGVNVPHVIPIFPETLCFTEQGSFSESDWRQSRGLRDRIPVGNIRLTT